MKKISLFNVLLFAAAILFAGALLSSCGSGDDNKSNPEDNNGQSSDEDFGSDGLKGYWVWNNWQDAIIESWTYWTYGNYSPTRETETSGQVARMIFLDGEGGGTMHTSVTTLDRVNNDSKFVSSDLGLFYDTSDGSTKEFYSFDKTYGHVRYSGYPSYMSGNENRDWTDNYFMDRVSALKYYIQGSTLTIFYNNTTETQDLNVSTGSKTSSGSVNYFHRLKKVN